MTHVADVNQDANVTDDEDVDLHQENNDNHNINRRNDDRRGNDQILQQMMEMQNQVVFTHKFTGSHRETLPYIFAMRRFFNINLFTNEMIKFRKVFNTLPVHFQNQFMTQHQNARQWTINNFETWMLRTYPPPQSKHDFLVKLKSIRLRRNEDPNIVYNAYQAKLDIVNQAITLLNESITDREEKLDVISNEQQMDILTGIFVRNNNEARYKNQGAINRLVVGYVGRKNPRKLRTGPHYSIVCSRS